MSSGERCRRRRVRQGGLGLIRFRIRGARGRWKHAGAGCVRTPDPSRRRADGRPGRAVLFKRSVEAVKNGIRWAALIAVLALAAGALAGAFALPQLAPQSAASVSDSREVPTVKRSFDDAHSVTAAPILSPEVSVLTSGGSGVVTASTCAPGAEVKTGDPLVSINGVPRIAIVSTVPLWRDLRLQDKGTDVSAVQTALTASGYPVTASGT